jgi:lysyl-tRNA synthetase class 2
MAARTTNLEQSRLEKIDLLRSEGIEPYPHRAERTHTSQEAISAYEIAELDNSTQPIKATLAGRIRSLRSMGKITFAHIEDGDGRVQLFFRANDIGQEQLELLNRERRDVPNQDR